MFSQEAHIVIDQDLAELLPSPKSPEDTGAIVGQPVRPFKKNRESPLESELAINLAPVFQTIFEKATPKPKPRSPLPSLEDLERENKRDGELEIFIGGRDILDLNTNIKSNWPFYSPSTDPVVRNYYKFSEVNDHYTIVRRMRDETDGAYYYRYPSAQELEADFEDGLMSTKF